MFVLMVCFVLIFVCQRLVNILDFQMRRGISEEMVAVVYLH